MSGEVAYVYNRTYPKTIVTSFGVPSNRAPGADRVAGERSMTELENMRKPPCSAKIVRAVLAFMLIEEF